MSREHLPQLAAVSRCGLSCGQTLHERQVTARWRSEYGGAIHKSTRQLGGCMKTLRKGYHGGTEGVPAQETRSMWVRACSCDATLNGAEVVPADVRRAFLIYKEFIYSTFTVSSHNTRVRHLLGAFACQPRISVFCATLPSSLYSLLPGTPHTAIHFLRCRASALVIECWCAPPPTTSQSTSSPDLRRPLPLETLWWRQASWCSVKLTKMQPVSFFHRPMSVHD